MAGGRGFERFLGRLTGTLPGRIVLRFLAIRGTERSLVVAGQCFTAVIPLLIVVSSIIPASSAGTTGDRIVRRFHLSREAAEAVRTLFARPAGVAQSLTVVSVVILVLSGLSLARTLQRTFEAAWELPPRGVRGTVYGLMALGLLLSEIMLLGLLVGLLRDVPGSSAVTFVARSIVAAALWLVLQWTLLGRRIALPRLVPGALAAGLGQQAVTLASGLWMPRLIEVDAARYGVIGVTFALLSWLVVIAVTLTVAAVAGAELGAGAEDRAA